MDIKNIRTDYIKRKLERKDLPNNPMFLFKDWLEELSLKNIKDFNAFTLSTVSKSHAPSSRVVLLRNIKKNGFVFFTNYDSQKGKDIINNNNVSMNFFWPEMERQVRIEGQVFKISDKESDDYFKSRPIKSQISALCSNQSEVIKDRKTLDDRYDEFSKQSHENIVRPQNWGGYIVKPSLIEFWQGRSNRLHDRFKYLLNKGLWILNRVSP